MTLFSLLVGALVLAAPPQDLRYRLAAPAESGWTFHESEYKARFARFDAESFALEVYEFQSALGPLGGSLVVTNKSDREMTLDLNRVYLQDKEGYVTEAIGDGQGWNLKQFDLIPEKAKKSGNFHFSMAFTDLRKGQDFTLRISGLAIDTARQSIPNLTFQATPSKEHGK